MPSRKCEGPNRYSLARSSAAFSGRQVVTMLQPRAQSPPASAKRRPGGYTVDERGPDHQAHRDHVGDEAPLEGRPNSTRVRDVRQRDEHMPDGEHEETTIDELDAECCGVPRPGPRQKPSSRPLMVMNVGDAISVMSRRTDASNS